jgi:integrase
VGERFVADFGNRLPSTIRPSEVKSWIHSRQEWRMAATRWGVLICLNRIFNWAINDRWITFNPLRGLSLPRGEPRRATTEAEIQTMLRHSPPHVRRALVFLRATGCRPGEMASLEWFWIDWEKHFAAIPKNRHKTGNKTGKPRYIPLPQVAMKLLAWMRRRCEQKGRVFRNSFGNPWTRIGLSQLLQRIRGQAVLAGTPLPLAATFHGIRHLYATLGIVASGNIKLVSQALGHQNVRTTESYYAHLEGSPALIEAAEAASKRQTGRKNR